MPIILKNKILEVEIGNPGEFYVGSRFDYSGNIRQVIFNGKHRFCSTEKSLYSAKYGFGFLSEFDIEEPFGYKEAKPGDNFYKIGVGYLKKKGNIPYDFFYSYEMEQLNFQISRLSSDSILYNSQSNTLQGYQIIYNKTVSISDNVLSIGYYLKNIGTRSLSTNEYCHNFLSIDNKNLNKGYKLVFNFDIDNNAFRESVNTENVLSFEGNSISWLKQPEKEFFISQLNSNYSGIANWSLFNSGVNAGINEKTDFVSSKINLWGTTHVVCPEVFHHIVLNSGEEKSWNREFTFY